MGPDAPQGPCPEASTFTRDPVQQAKDWLLRHGIAAPDADPELDRPVDAGSQDRPTSPEPRPSAPTGGGDASVISGPEGRIKDPASERPATSQSLRQVFSGEPSLTGGMPAELPNFVGPTVEPVAGERAIVDESTPGVSDEGGPEGPEANPEAVARSIVLAKLTSQARTRTELDRTLKAKRVPPEVAEDVLDRMESLGLVDDAAFANDWVDSRQQRRQLSRGALRRELVAKGVDSEHIAAALERVDVDDELRAARSLAEKKLRSMAEIDRQAQVRRLAGALTRRGFEVAIITRVLAEVDEQAGK